MRLLSEAPFMPRVPAARRFWAKVQGGEDGLSCWTWTGATDQGYGKFKIERRGVLAHRWIYEYMRAEIPDGLVLDHLCRNTACVNPWHLEPVTAGENTARSNVLRGGSAANRARSAAITHCPSGHPYDEENTYVTPGGYRNCRACHRQRSRRHMAQRRAARSG